MRRAAYTLVEVLVAGAILLVGLVPILSLLTSSSTEVVKARDRNAAIGLATSLAEDLRMRRDVDRTSIAPVSPQGLAHLAPILNAYRAKLAAGPNPGLAVSLDRNFNNFTCAATVPPAVAVPMRIEITWTEAGVVRRHELEAVRPSP